MTIDEAIKHCLEVAEQQENSADDKEMYSEMLGEDYKGFEEDCQECAAEHRQLAEWLTELKELRKLTVINPTIAGYNEVYEKLIKGDIEASNDKELLKTAVGALENVMPKYRRLSEENQKQKEQIAEYKRLLKAAVDDLNFESQCRNCKHKEYGLNTVCKECRGNKYEWRYADKALKLIGGSENGT